MLEVLCLNSIGTKHTIEWKKFTAENLKSSLVLPFFADTVLSSGPVSLIVGT
jgi:hypothetical protein